MPAKQTSSPYHKIRRKDRAVEDEVWISAFLHETAIGTLATASNDQPFLNANLFAYDEKKHAIYIHTARTGRTRENIEKNPRVCFIASAMGRLLPADVALEFSVEFSGVTVFGTASVLDSVDEAKFALQMLLDKYFSHLKPGKDYRPITQSELKRTAVYKISIDNWSGKQKKVADDFPGAFSYE